MDPHAQIVHLLQPEASFTKLVNGAGSWAVHRSEARRPFYCAVLEGSCRLASEGAPPVVLSCGDFALLPSAQRFTISSMDRSPSDPHGSVPIEVEPGVYRLGGNDTAPDVRILIGYGMFGSVDATLLVSLLPPIVHVRGDGRLTTLVQLVDDETRAVRPARDVVLTRLLEVLLIEALRSTAGPTAPPGLLRGLSDDRLAAALRGMHDKPARPWTVTELAFEANLSRSAFFDRFRRALGVAPMAYLLHWRMSLAGNLLTQRELSIAEVARRAGYGSTSAFSVAFSKYASVSPTSYARREVTALAP
ncbi:AraC family transcriptional regulator [Sphingomonas koreensis]|nr:AraC family transcriptional regulator [Sphingomonas koreensis]